MYDSAAQRVYIFDVESSRVVAFVDGHDNDVNAVRPCRCLLRPVCLCACVPLAALHVTHPSNSAHMIQSSVGLSPPPCIKLLTLSLVIHCRWPTWTQHQTYLPRGATTPPLRYASRRGGG